MKRLYKICIFLSLLGGTLAAPAFAGHTYLQPASEPAAYRFDADITNNSLAISPNEHWAAASNSNHRESESSISRTGICARNSTAS